MLSLFVLHPIPPSNWRVVGALWLISCVRMMYVPSFINQNNIFQPETRRERRCSFFRKPVSLSLSLSSVSLFSLSVSLYLSFPIYLSISFYIYIHTTYFLYNFNTSFFRIKCFPERQNPRTWFSFTFQVYLLKNVSFPAQERILISDLFPHSFLPFLKNGTS